MVSFFTTTHLPTIDTQQAALEAERDRLRMVYEHTRDQLFNIEDALRRLQARRHALVYGKRESAA